MKGCWYLRRSVWDEPGCSKAIRKILIARGAQGCGPTKGTLPLAVSLERQWRDRFSCPPSPNEQTSASKQRERERKKEGKKERKKEADPSWLRCVQKPPRPVENSMALPLNHKRAVKGTAVQVVLLQKQGKMQLEFSIGEQGSAQNDYVRLCLAQKTEESIPKS